MSPRPRRSASGPPHGGHDRAAAEVAELAVRFEADAGVPVVIGGVGGLQVGRLMLGVDEFEVVGEQAHADPLAPVIGVGAQQGQVVVRLGPRVRRIEPADQLQVVARGGTQTVGSQFCQALLLLG